MNKIHSPLGYPGALTINNITWITKAKKSKTGKEQVSVPLISGLPDAHAAEIWQQYFDLIFLHYDILKHFEANKSKLGPDDKISGFDKDELLGLLIADPRQKTDLCKIAPGKEHPLFKIFDYKRLTSQFRSRFSALIQSLNINVCPYCGRSFIHTVKKRGDGFIRTCQVDHFLPKSQYPWLAFSIWNFVPVCGSCNLRKTSNTNEIFYPYEEGIGDLYRFRTHPVKGLGYLVGARDSENDFEVSLDCAVKSDMFDGMKSKMGTEDSIFGINELYSTHNSYICGIFRQRYIFGTPYIDSICSSFKNMFHNREDVLAMMYLKRIDAESIGTSPLDKLTRDINHEIDLLE